MSKLEVFLDEISAEAEITFTDKGQFNCIFKLISALRKALDQRNEWVAEKYKDPSIKNREQQDAEILQILEGE